MIINGNNTFLILFTCLQVDLSALRQMGERDLKDMGVPMVGWKFTDFCLHHGSILASLRKSKYDLRLSPASILSYPIFQTSYVNSVSYNKFSILHDQLWTTLGYLQQTLYLISYFKLHCTNSAINNTKHYFA